MNHITEIDDPRLVKGLAHPLRVEILRIVQDGVASPNEIAQRLNAPLGNVSYHVRFLARVGLIELSSTAPRRGAVEHFYRAAEGVRMTAEVWEQMPRVARDAVLAPTLDQIGRELGTAITEGGFDRPKAQVVRLAVVVDDDGFAELSAAVRQLAHRAEEIERESMERLAARDHAEGSVPDGAQATLGAGLALMLYDRTAAG